MSRRKSGSARPSRRRGALGWLWRLVRSRLVWLAALLLAVYLLARAYIPEYALAAVAITALFVALWTVRRWWRRFRRKQTIDDLVEMSPAEFEQAVARLLTKQGFRGVRRTGGAGDLNADIVGYDPRGRSVVVQCKRYRPGKGIGSETIQTFIGMQRVHHQAERGIFVTTASFTKPARQLAARHGITLVDGDELARLLLNGGRAKWARDASA